MEEKLIKKLVRFIYFSSKDTMTYQYLERFKNTDDSCYSYIPSYVEEISSLFIYILNDIKLYNKDINQLSFMDAGCGIPVIPKIAQFMGFGYTRTFGLENNPHFKYIANVGCFQLIDENYIVQDIRDHNFENYNYIYSHNPIRENSDMKLGLLKIIKTMKPGATFFFNPARINEEELDIFGFFKSNQDGSSNLWVYKKE